MVTDKKETLQPKFSERLWKEKCEKLEDWCTGGGGGYHIEYGYHVAFVGYS